MSKMFYLFKNRFMVSMQNDVGMKTYFPLPSRERELWRGAAFLALFVSGCATASPSSDLLKLSQLDETFVDRAGPETQNIYDPITLLQQGEAYTVKEEHGLAAEAYKRFLELYPSHRMAPFAEYALGTSYTNQIRTSDRDPTPIEQALEAFRDLLTRYPATPYADEAVRQIKTLEKYQAEYQFGIGRYYYKQKAYNAAIARFEKGLVKGDFGEVTERTLYYIGRSYLKNGDPEKAQQAFDHLRARYPDSDYLTRTAVTYPTL